MTRNIISRSSKPQMVPGLLPTRASTSAGQQKEKPRGEFAMTQLFSTTGLHRAEKRVEAEYPKSAQGWESKTGERPVGAEEAAKFLNMTRSTVLSLSRRGIIPAHPIGTGLRRRWLFFLSELEVYVRSTGVNCGSHPCAS